MGSSNHRHITHSSIEKYLGIDLENCTEDDLEFIEYFDNCLEDCEVCTKRFGVSNFLSVLVDGEPEESFVHEPNEAVQAVKASTPSLEKLDALVSGWVRSFKDNLQDFGEVVRAFTIMPLPAMATRSAESSSASDDFVSIKQGEPDGQYGAVCVSLQEGEDCFEFEIFCPSLLLITTKVKNANLLHEVILCQEGEAPVRLAMRKTSEANELGAKTDELPIGKYVGAVVRVC